MKFPWSTRLGGPGGRLISASDREKAVELIDGARVAGAKLKPACEVLGISERTYGGLTMAL